MITLAYGTNGLTDHRLDDALGLLAEHGYGGVALTLDHMHLDPLAPGLVARTALVRGMLERHGLQVVVETGARYVLDPRRKHEPTLLSDDGAERRLDLLRTAVDVAADLGSRVVHLWSGILPAGTAPATGRARLRAGLEELLPVAEAAGVVLAFEPEPGMLVERVDDVLDLRRALGDPDALRLTVDVGHLTCVEDAPGPDVVRRVADLIAHVQVDDMVRGVHEHLELGTGAVDLPGVLAALHESGFGGLAAVELPRHSHAAARLVASSAEAIRAAAHAADVPLRERAPLQTQEVTR
ncbi:sugar phosphate isomerase/epimerase [Isoptericola sp. S6320L]|uniref:sugar phosphate isomerase/epimerase family protein n=1 Tax=Isoptericola sp. S6320L TaxID=2926411 RepID=UPI001FF461E6|nr:sugar phosphate isomerase/epimerase family protein [Isoptericola sp. S6320L]MCK0116731.1 sugar phosphate isomerase/epimerase [Isoptericola sp. S6320L]